jgi:hypothetical protein
VDNALFEGLAVTINFLAWAKILPIFSLTDVWSRYPTIVEQSMDFFECYQCITAMHTAVSVFYKSETARLAFAF